MNYLRQFIKHVIMESTIKHDGLAAFVYKYRGNKCAVIYDYDTLITELGFSSRLYRNTLANYLEKHVLKGMIEVGPPPVDVGKCNDAWVVYRSAGPGLGKLIYSIGYALSPSGKIMPDRDFVSNSADSAWRSLQGKPQYKKEPLDDIDAHEQDGSVKYDHPHHTTTIKDDCRIHVGDPHLNYSYKGTGEERAVLDSLIKEHQYCMETFTSDEIEIIELNLKKAADILFSRHFDSQL